MSDESMKLNTYTEVYDANYYAEYKTRQVELFSPVFVVPHKTVLGMSGHSELSSRLSPSRRRPASLKFRYPYLSSLIPSINWCDRGESNP